MRSGKSSKSPEEIRRETLRKMIKEDQRHARAAAKVLTYVVLSAIAVAIVTIGVLIRHYS